MLDPELYPHKLFLGRRIFLFHPQTQTSLARSLLWLERNPWTCTLETLPKQKDLSQQRTSVQLELLSVAAQEDNVKRDVIGHSSEPYDIRFHKVVCAKVKLRANKDCSVSVCL